MCASIGTPCEMDTKGKILFIEELCEHIGNLDRYIYQLRNAGKLRDAAGILIGHITDCNLDERDYDVVRVIMEATAELDIPIMYNIQSGHGFPMITLPMGGMCVMDTDTNQLFFPIGENNPKI